MYPCNKFEKIILMMMMPVLSQVSNILTSESRS